MEKVSPQWNWIICNLPLKQFLNGENICWFLQPSITLSHPSGEGPDPNIKILLDQEKSFQYTDELGWNWHKSWKLPTISFQLDITDSEKGETLLCPKDIYVHIFAVKALVDSNNKLCLVDVGLRGTNKMELVDGKATFQTLKFASTSYNNEGVKFHLLMCAYLQISEDTKPKMLKAIISPPIFVDSRKSVRDNEKLSENRLFLYIEPFYPDNFTRKFVKKETKKKESIEDEIQNSIDGLHSYLTAPNIRNKVKHPIFLCVRFSSCISLFYNPDLVTEDDKDNLIEFFQGLLLEDIEKGQEANETRLQDSYFILCINKNELEDKLRKKKILEILCPIKCRSLSVVFNKAEIPPNFVQIQELRNLMELYSKSYSKLLIKSKYYLRGEEDNEDEDGPTDKIPPPDRQLISFSYENAPRTQNDWNKYFDTSSCAYEEDPQKKIKEDPTAPMQMMEARTISYRESMSKLFPNNQEHINPSAPVPVNSQITGFPGMKSGNPLLMNVFQKKGAETPAAAGGVPQFSSNVVGNPSVPNLNPGMQNPAMPRFPPGRGQPYGMEAMMSMMMQGNNKLNPMNMMNPMGQRGPQFNGMGNFHQMMMGNKDGDVGNVQMTPERMQAFMQNLQQQRQQQMYQRVDDLGVKTENVSGNQNMSGIQVKVLEDDKVAETGRNNARRNNKNRNDINVKDEEPMN